jgi:Fe-S oxidoreductase
MKKVLYLGSANLHYQQMPEVDEHIKELFQKCEVEYVVLPNEKHCVEGLYPLGFKELARKEAIKFYDEVKDLDIDAIVTPYGASQSMWTNVYPDEFGLKLDVPFYNVTQFFYLKAKELNVQFDPLPMKLAMHDGCTVGRKLGVVKEPRELLKKIPELQLVEQQHPSIGIDGTTAADWSTCPGAWLNMTIPELADEVEKNFIEKNIMPLQVDAVTTDCANALFGIRMGIMKGNYPLKSYFFTDIINMVWRA